MDKENKMIINRDFPSAYTIDDTGLDSLCYFLKKHFLNKTVIIHVEEEKEVQQ
jgi:hypothetical protein